MGSHEVVEGPQQIECVGQLLGHSHWAWKAAAEVGASGVDVEVQALDLSSVETLRVLGAVESEFEAGWCRAALRLGGRRG